MGKFIFKSFIVRDLYNQKLLPYAVAQDQLLQESSLKQLKWFNIRVDPILWISRILNFSAKCSSRKILQKFSIHEIQIQIIIREI